MENREQEILKMLELDIKNLKEPLKETITEIVKQGYSEYPILIAHPEDIAFADKIIDRELFNSSFHFSASTLEKMVERGVVLKDKEQAIQDRIKGAGESACFLLLHPEIMRFIFAPLSS